MSYKTTKNFWINRKHYPDYPYTKERRLIDVNFIIDNMDSPDSVLDLGCAEGYLLNALKHTDIKMFYGYDISKKLLDSLISEWKDIKKLEIKVCDFTKHIDFPEADLTLSMGMFPYIFKYYDLYSILAEIKSDMLIVRAPCTLKDNDEYINKYSKELQENYACVYRTAQSYHTILRIFYTNVYIERSYPDIIESKYGTKHYYFVCKKRKELWI